MSWLRNKKISFRCRHTEDIVIVYLLEDKIVRHFVGLRIITLLLVFVLVVSSCATSDNKATDTGFGFIAEAVSEGILLTFSNIPSDSVRLFIAVQSWDDTGEMGHYNRISSFADIRDASFPYGAISSFQLERVKETGRVIFPIVQMGQKYTISASVQSRSDLDNGIEPVFIEVEVTAENGIYFNRDGVQFELNDTNSAVTLHSMPLFSSSVVFHAQKIEFNTVVSVMDVGSISVGTHHIPAGLSSDGLTWTFQPQMTDSLRADNNGWLQSGSYYPAWSVVYANIVHDDIVWSVEIAKTSIFDFSL